MLCSEPTAHSSTKIWSLSSCQASALLLTAAQQHLKEDSHRHSGLVTLEIQKDLSAFILMGLENSTRHGQKPGASHSGCGNDCHTQALRNEGAGDPSDILSAAAAGAGRGLAGSDSPVCAPWPEPGHPAQHRAWGAPGQCWTGGSFNQGGTLSAAPNFSGLVTLLPASTH